LLVFAERRHQRWVEGSVPSGRHPRSPPAAGRRRRTDHDQHHLWRAATRPSVLPRSGRSVGGDSHRSTRPRRVVEAW